MILIDIEASLPTEQLEQVTFSLSSIDEPSDERHSFTSQAVNPSINQIILSALRKPRLDQFAKIFSFLACADRISDSGVDCFRALDEISHTLFLIYESSPQLFSDLSTTWYGIPEFNVNNLLGLGLWYWQSHRHAFKVLEHKMDRLHKQKRASGNGNTSKNPQFHDPFHHDSLSNNQTSNNNSNNGNKNFEENAKYEREQHALLKELSGIGNVSDQPYYFQKYMLRWTVRPIGDTAIQHLEHLEPPPSNMSKIPTSIGATSAAYPFANGNSAHSGKLPRRSPYAIRYSTEWLPNSSNNQGVPGSSSSSGSQQVAINIDTGLVEQWAPDPEFRPVSGEFVLLLEPPVYFPRHMATQMDAVFEQDSTSYLNNTFVNSRRRVFGPNKESSSKMDESRHSVSRDGDVEMTDAFHTGRDTNREGSSAGTGTGSQTDGASVLLGSGFAHGGSTAEAVSSFFDGNHENTNSDEFMDLEINFSSFIPYSFVKVVEIPVSHPKNLPNIILNLRKCILLDTLCRSLNLHELSVPYDGTDIDLSAHARRNTFAGSINLNKGSNAGINPMAPNTYGATINIGNVNNNTRLNPLQQQQQQGQFRRQFQQQQKLQQQQQLQDQQNPDSKPQSKGSNQDDLSRSQAHSLQPIATQDTEAEDDNEEGLDSDLLLMDGLLKEAIEMEEEEETAQVSNENDSLNPDASGQVNISMSNLESPLQVNVTLIEDMENANSQQQQQQQQSDTTNSLSFNEAVHIVVSIPALHNFGFWVTPKVKSSGTLGFSVSHIGFSVTKTGKHGNTRPSRVSREGSTMQFSIDNNSSNIKSDLNRSNSQNAKIPITIKEEGGLDDPASILESVFDSSNQSNGNENNGTGTNSLGWDIDWKGIQSKLENSLELTEDLGLVCKYACHLLCK